MPLEFPQVAMVMAAGFGTRMRPITDKLPKPLVKVLGRPLIDYSLDFLASSGVKKAVVNSYYLADLLEGHLRSRIIAPQIIISRENEILETGGGIKNALHLLGSEPFFVLNSDVICIDGKEKALHRLCQSWDGSKMDALLLLHRVEDAVGYNGKGDFFIEDGGKLRRREENETAPYVFTGVQLLSQRLFTNSPDGKFSLNVLYNRNLMRLCAIIHDGAWLHIGSQSELEKAEAWLGNNLKKIG